MLIIYGVLRSRASRNIWLAHEIGLPFQHVPVIQANRLSEPDATDAPMHTRSAAYLTVNSIGHIPVAIDSLRALFAVLDQELGKTGFLAGGRFTVADVTVAEVVRYALPAPELFPATPALRRWVEACHARPAYKRMMAHREIEPA